MKLESDTYFASGQLESPSRESLMRAIFSKRETKCQIIELLFVTADYGDCFCKLSYMSILM